MEEVIEILRLYDEQCDKKLPRMHMVFGNYKADRHQVRREGHLRGRLLPVGGQDRQRGVKGGELYKDRSRIDPYLAAHKDVYARMLKMNVKPARGQGEAVDTPRRVPVSIGELVMLLAELGNIQNPYFDKRQILGFNRSYLAWRASTALARLRGQALSDSRCGPARLGAAGVSP